MTRKLIVPNSYVCQNHKINYLCNYKSTENTLKTIRQNFRKYEERKGKRKDGTRFLIDKNEKNAIPGVHFRKDR
jgi:hypothetical protein